MAANPPLDNARSSHSIPVVTFPLLSALRAAGTTLVRWLRTAEARRYLDRLDNRTLLDIGFDPDEARHEAAKPFWKPYTLVHNWDR